MQDEHWPGALTDDEITLPMTSLPAGFDRFRPVVDRGTILDRIARWPCPPGPATFMPAGEITPEFMRLLGDAVDEGINGFAADDPEADARCLP
jgi:hypothetical protein